jgi:hypothetical protein
MESMAGSLRERIVDMVRIMLGRSPKYAEGPDPIEPPKRPRPSSAIALPLPDPEIHDVDAVGPPLPPDWSGDDVQERGVG